MQQVKVSDKKPFSSWVREQQLRLRCQYGGNDHVPTIVLFTNSNYRTINNRTSIETILVDLDGLLILDLFNIYEANAHSINNQAGLVKSVLVNEIPLSLVFMILISSMKIED